MHFNSNFSDILLQLARYMAIFQHLAEKL